MSERDIAIVGMSCAFPQALDIRQYWSNNVNGVDCIEAVPEYRWRHLRALERAPEHEAYLGNCRGGFLPDRVLFDARRFGVIPNSVRHGDPDQFLMLGLIDEALHDAGVASDARVRERTDVIIGRGGYVSQKLSELLMAGEFFDMAVQLIERGFPDLMQGRRDEVEEYLRSTLSPRESDNISTAIPNIVAGLCANRLNLGGLANVVDGACASSLLAVEQAITRLRLGQADLAVAGGQFLTNRPSMHYVFSKLGAVSRSGQIRPFDRRADGIVIGEGAGAVVLKRVEDALRDGDRVYAVIKGVGVSSDGRGRDVLAPSSDGQVKALERAYHDANLDPETIEYLEAHGTGTVAGDEAELESVNRVFGRSTASIKTRAMGSVKSMIGHLMPAAGMAALIRTALALSNKILPPSLHCEQPRAALGESQFYINTQVRPWIHDPRRPPRRAAINSFGFGGVNAHVVLEEVPAAPSGSRALRCRPFENHRHRETELLAFAASTLDDLRQQLDCVTSFLANDETKPSLADVAASLVAQLDLRQPVKLALICHDLAELRKLIGDVQTKLDSGVTTFADDGTIHFSTQASQHSGQVACLFPGQGFPGLIGNYPDHLAELCLHYECVREQFDFLELRDMHPEDSVPTSVVFWPPEHLGPEVRAQLRQRLAPAATDADSPLLKEFRPDERYLSTIGVTLANWASWLLVNKFEVPIDMIAGQSQGEMAAVCAAGVYEFRDTVPAYWALLNPNPLLAPNGRMAFAWISEEALLPYIEAHPGTHIAICMSPEATVLGGDREALMQLVDKLREADQFVHLLPYPPIHTPLLSHLREELLASLDTSKLPSQPAKIALYSSITAEPFPTDQQAIQDTLMMNVDCPLRVWQTLRRLHSDGARIFLQMGGGHLAAHLSEYLGTEDEITAVAVDVETRSPLDQLNQFMATLFCRGVPLDLQPLFLHRQVRQLDLQAPQPAAKPAVTTIPLRIDWSPLEHPNAQPRELPPASTAPPSATPAAAVATPSTNLPPSAPPAVTYTTGFPLLGELWQYEPGQALVARRQFSLDRDMFLYDHRFVHALEVKSVEDCMPVVPMTFTIELTLEAAQSLLPDLTVIGCEQVRAMRWIALRQVRAIDVEIRAEVQQVDAETGVHRVLVQVWFEEKLSASVVVLLAAVYREDLQLTISPPAEEGDWPWAVDELYTERFMFHGPRFHAITGLGKFGNPTYAGELTMLPPDQLFADDPQPQLISDPVALDALGQLFGAWCATLGWESLPIGIEKIEFYRTPPPPGTRIEVVVEILEFEPMLRRISCQLEAGDGAGGVWLRAYGWADWLYRTPARLKDFIRFPARYLFADPLAPPELNGEYAVTAVKHAEMTHADSEWIASALLTTAEMAERAAIVNEDQQRAYLASRFAVKDAVRLWMLPRNVAEQAADPEAALHPAGIRIEHDTHGRPYAVHPQGLSMPQISLAHSDTLSVAIAADTVVGIDCEPCARDAAAILPQFATDDERTLLQELIAHQPTAAWAVRLWCAKEATGKLLGSGLDGRPKDFQMLDADDSGTLLICHEPTGTRCVVTTFVHADSIVAIARVEAEWTAPS